MLRLLSAVPAWAWIALAVVGGLFGLKLVWRREWVQDRTIAVQARAIEQSEERERHDDEIQSLPDDDLAGRLGRWGVRPND